MRISRYRDKNTTQHNTTKPSPFTVKQKLMMRTGRGPLAILRARAWKKLCWGYEDAPQTVAFCPDHNTSMLKLAILARSHSG
eukprot:3941939-Rhodomonas_salina.4